MSMSIEIQLNTLRTTPGGDGVLRELRKLAAEGVDVFLGSGRDKQKTAEAITQNDMPARLKAAARRAAEVVPDLREWSEKGDGMWTDLVRGLLLLRFIDEPDEGVEE